MAKKPMRIGIIGYGFMGRAHSNAYRQVGQFFDLGYRPVLKAASARDGAKLAEFATELFAQRRKQLGSVVARMGGAVTLPQGVTAQMRAEELTVAQVAAMASGAG